MNHTPAPWEFYKYEQWGRTSFYIAQKDGAPYTPGYSDVANCIAQTVSPEKVSTQEANARLIAAAPELLGAVKDLLSGWTYIREVHGDLYGVGWDRAQEKAQSAIAKATGEQA